MKIKDYKERVRDFTLAKLKELNLEEIPVEFTRTNKRLGGFHFWTDSIGGYDRAWKLSFSENLFYNEWSRIEQILLHEIAHYLQSERTGKTGHGEEFKKTCKEIGCKESGGTVSESYRARYVVECVGCGATYCTSNKSKYLGWLHATHNCDNGEKHCLIFKEDLGTLTEFLKNV